MRKQPKRPKRKIVLFIVEGQSDQLILEIPLSTIFDCFDPDLTLKFASIDKDVSWNGQSGGDITALIGVSPDNIEKKLFSKIIEPFLEKEKCYAKDLYQIIQIVDLDGAFIPEDAVIENPSCEHFLYTDSSIQAKEREKVIDRNKRKSANIKKLVEMQSIKIASKTIDYSVYFFSRDIDHYIHNDANMDWQIKHSRANDFLNKCISNPILFYETICKKDTCIDMSYNESWNYIQDNPLESLHRHTNLNILVESLFSKEKDTNN